MDRLSRHEEFVKGLRDLADWYEARPELPAPVMTNFYVFVYNANEFKRLARIAGSGRKVQNSGYLGLERSFGPIEWKLNVAQERVCERVQTGTKDIPAKPAEPAKPSRTEPVYEWRCPESILR